MGRKIICMAVAAWLTCMAGTAGAKALTNDVEVDGVTLRCDLSLDAFKGRVDRVVAKYYYKGEFTIIKALCDVSYPKGRGRVECSDVRTSPSANGDFEPGKQYSVTPGGTFRYNVTEDDDATEICTKVLTEGAQFKILK